MDTTDPAHDTTLVLELCVPHSAVTCSAEDGGGGGAGGGDHGGGGGGQLRLAVALKLVSVRSVFRLGNFFHGLPF
jgi:hypothetical protein